MSHKKSVLSTSAFIVCSGVALLLMWDLPGGVTFRAPHQSSGQAFVSRLKFNHRAAARLVSQVLQYTSIPVVYAQECSAPEPCDGTKPVASGEIPFCILPQICAKFECDFVGGRTLCQSNSFKCTQPGVTVICNSAVNVRCQ
jgi:hypothetical protein